MNAPTSHDPGLVERLDTLDLEIDRLRARARTLRQRGAHGYVGEVEETTSGLTDTRSVHRQCRALPEIRQRLGWPWS